jgi:hypothetical protein
VNVPGPKTRYPAGPHNSHGIDAGISDTNEHYNLWGPSNEVPYGGGKFMGGVQQQPAFHPHPQPSPAPIAYPGAVMMLMHMMRGGGGPGSPGFIAPP